MAFALRRLARYVSWPSVVALLLAYKYGRVLDEGSRPRRHSTTPATSSGIERSLGVFSEARMQDLVLHDTAVVRFLNVVLPASRTSR